MKGPLIEFLTESIEDFSWTKCHELYSSKNDLITCEKFHESFQGLSNLIFIFIGETRIIGSFFSCKYPSMNNRLKKDENSFIFISKSNSSEFIKYNACKEAEHHISISEKTFICQGNTPSYGDGIRTFHKNFEELLFCLPTNTYLCTEKDMETESGTLKVRRFMILQVP